VGVGPADGVDAGQLGRRWLGHLVVRAHGIDEAEGPALLAGTVVRQQQHDGVVQLAAGLQVIEQPGQLLVGMVQHGGIGSLQARHHRLLLGRMVGPGLDAGIARRQLGVRRHDAQRLLPRQAAFTLHVPAVAELRIVLADQCVRRLVRRMAGTQRQPQVPGAARLVGLVVGQVADALVDQVGRQVVAGLERLPGVGMGVLSRTSSGAYWSVSASMKP
jgi:hypothetical protein